MSNAVQAWGHIPILRQVWDGTAQQLELAICREKHCRQGLLWIEIANDPEKRCGTFRRGPINWRWRLIHKMFVEGRNWQQIELTQVGHDVKD